MRAEGGTALGLGVVDVGVADVGAAVVEVSPVFADAAEIEEAGLGGVDAEGVPDAGVVVEAEEAPRETDPGVEAGGAASAVFAAVVCTGGVLDVDGDGGLD